MVEPYPSEKWWSESQMGVSEIPNQMESHVFHSCINNSPVLAINNPYIPILDIVYSQYDGKVIIHSCSSHHQAVLIHKPENLTILGMLLQPSSLDPRIVVRSVIFEFALEHDRLHQLRKQSGGNICVYSLAQSILVGGLIRLFILPKSC